jgi:hypothetical protein
MLQQYRWQEHMMQEIKVNLSDFEADEFFFTKAEFEKLSWREGRKEFIRDGKYYDVIEIKSVYGGMVIKCVNDQEEAFLMQRYINAGKGEHNPFHALVKGVINNLLFKQHSTCLAFSTMNFVEEQEPTAAYVFAIKEAIQKIPVPPPSFF